MRQITFASQPSFEKYGRMSRREAFLTSMDTIVPWSELEAFIAPYYPKAGKGRQSVGLGIMLRIYFLQHWFNLSDPGAEDALYESPVLRVFPESIWVGPPRPMKPPFSTSATCWKSTS
jgi:IS5 family transposase